nr:hypothetical protein [Bacteroidota bacterium]
MNTFAFQTKLESNVLKLYNIENLIGKEVIITIVEIPSIEPKKKCKWNYIGAVQLNGELDTINIRDFAND